MLEEREESNLLNALRDKTTGGLNLWKAEKWEEKYQHGTEHSETPRWAAKWGLHKDFQREAGHSWLLYASGVFQCQWALPWGWFLCWAPAQAAWVEVHQWPSVHQAMQDCRISKGKPKVVQITQTVNGDSHRFPVGCSVFTCVFRVVVVSWKEISGCLF